MSLNVLLQRGVRTQYYNGAFIEKNEFVDKHLEDIGYDLEVGSLARLLLYNCIEMLHAVPLHIRRLPLNLACVALLGGKQLRQHQRQCHTWMKLDWKLRAAGTGSHKKQSTCSVEKCKMLPLINCLCMHMEW